MGLSSKICAGKINEWGFVYFSRQSALISGGRPPERTSLALLVFFTSNVETQWIRPIHFISVSPRKVILQCCKLKRVSIKCHYKAIGGPVNHSSLMLLAEN